MGTRMIRIVLAVVVNVLIVVAVLLAVRLVAVFTASFAHSGWGGAVIRVTDHLVIPFGFGAGVPTPYGGSFDLGAAITIVLILVAEWMLSGIRDRA